MKTTPNRFHQFALASIAAAVLAACASAPSRNAALDDAQAGYDRAAGDTLVARSAPLELRKAQEALQQANVAQRAGDDPAAVEHYAYLAKQRTETALQATTIVQTEQAVADASQKRDGILIASRTREAEAERSLADKARFDADAQRTLADKARFDAEAQRTLADKAHVDTETQRTLADKAQLDADAQRNQAEAARNVAETRLTDAQASQAQAASERARAKSLEDQLAELKAKPTDRGMVLTLGDVLFDTGRAELNPGAIRPLDQLSLFLKQNPQRTVAIEGYTDSSGTVPTNQVLSERRAIAVKNALIDRGVALNRMSARGLGEASPVSTNTTAAGRQRNRRVEIVLSDAQ